MTSGGGRRLISSLVPKLEPTELTLAILDVESDLECPRAGPLLPPVPALALAVPVLGLTLSVRSCR